MANFDVEITNENKRNNSKRISMKYRIKRLHEFLTEYLELWYNPKMFERNLNEITKNKKEQEIIRAKFKQAEEDYTSIRSALKRQKTARYAISEKDIEILIDDNVGRALGVSKKNIQKKDMLINNYGYDEDSVDYIYRMYGTLEGLKKEYIRALNNKTYKSFMKDMKRFDITFITDLDISLVNKVRTSNRGYVDFLKDVFQQEFIIFDGQELVSRVNQYMKDYLTERQIDIVRAYYGFDTERMSYDKIAKMKGSSYSRIGQIMSVAMENMRINKSEIRDLIFIGQEGQAQNYLINFFNDGNDVIMPNNEQNQDISNEANIVHLEHKMNVAQTNVLESIKNFYIQSGELDNNSVENQKRAEILINRVPKCIDEIKYLSDDEKIELESRIYGSKEFLSTMLMMNIKYNDKVNQRTAVKQYEGKLKNLILNSKYISEETRAELLSKLSTRLDEVVTDNKKSIQEKIDLLTKLKSTCIGDIKIEDTEMKARAKNSILRSGIRTIGELMDISRDKSTCLEKKLVYSGKDTVDKIREYLATMGLMLEDAECDKHICENNQIILKKPNPTNIPKELQYYRHIQSEIDGLYLTDELETELNEYLLDVISAKEYNNSHEDEITFIKRRIENIGSKKMNATIPISTLNMPEEIEEYLEQFNIYTVVELARTSREKFNSFPGMTSTYMQELEYFFNCLGVEIKEKEEDLKNTFLSEIVLYNKNNVRAIENAIKKACINKEEEKELMEALITKVNEVKVALNERNIKSKNVANQIQQLAEAYKNLISERKEHDYLQSQLRAIEATQKENVEQPKAIEATPKEAPEQK